MFEKVICATDGSENADRAFQYAIQLAESEGATLHAVHVVEKLLGPRVGGMNSHVDESEIDAKIKRQVETAGKKLGSPVTMHVMASPNGEVAKRIAETASDLSADLIIVGTRGHSAISGALLGSVTQRLLHVTTCPVLAVPPVKSAAKSPESAELISTAR
jgi:nucleotide-binding universal stress UspA family protein